MKGVTEENGIYNVNRFTYIEPNEFASYYNLKNSTVDYRGLSWNPEDLSISVDLQVIIPNRGDKGQINYTTKIDDVVLHSNGSTPLANYISYLGGTKLSKNKDDKSFLTDNYTNISFGEMKDGKYVDKESLGISLIDINFDAHFFPIVTIKFTDVRGSSLFMPSEYNFDKSVGLVDDNSTDSVQSFFSSLFHFPYPRFLLSVKGFYGNKVTFQLAVSDFKSSLKSESGDYDITVQFIGYVYGLYTDLPLNLVLASPYFNEEYWVNKVKDGTFKYVSSNGGIGQEIIPYVKFITLVNEKNINKDVLANNTNVKDFLLKKEKIKSLERILSVHNRLSTDTSIFVKQVNECCVGNKCVFMYKTVDNVFKLNDDISKEYYDEIRNYLNTFGDLYYLNSSPYYKHLSNAVNDNINLIKNDTKYEYLDEFKTFDGIKINKYFDVNPTTGKINKLAGGRFKKETDGDAFLEKQYVEVDYNKINKILMPGVESGLVINYYDYSNFLTVEIEKLKIELKNEENDIVEDLGKVFEDIIGFSPTVENFYRMLFAHIDCFMDYFYTKVLDKITDATNKGERTINYLGVPIDSLDIPKSLIGSNDKNKDELSVFPFPGYFTENLSLNGSRMVATYPGESSSQNFRNIREVSCVDEMSEGIDLLGKEMNAFLASQNSTNNDTEYGNSMLSILSVLYGGVNPWSNFNFDSQDDTLNIYKILFFYITQLISEKCIGVNIDENGYIKENYIDRQVNAFLKSGVQLSETLKNAIKHYGNNTEALRQNIMSYDNMSNYKLYNFRDEINNTDTIHVYEEYNENVVLTPSSSILTTENSGLTDEEKVKYNAIGIGEEKDCIGKNSVINLPNGTSVDYDTLKKWNSDLYQIENATEYLKNEPHFGKWAVSLLLDEIPAYKACDNEIIPFVPYNEERYVTWYYSLSDGITSADYDNVDYCSCWHHIHMEDNNIYNSLFKYYNQGVKEKSVNFVGRKKSGESILNTLTKVFERNVSDIAYTDLRTSSNLFSGVKYAQNMFGKEVEIEKNDDYLPLIDSKRCNTDEITGVTNEEKIEIKNRAFATYFLATLCGRNSLGNIIEIFKTGNSFAPLRKVDMLYLGASLYFAMTDYSAWNKSGGKKKVAELIKNDYAGYIENGTLGHGLLETTYNSGAQKTYDIDIFLSNDNLNHIGNELVNRFKDWCDNDLFGSGMYNKLATVMETDDENYVNLMGYASKNINSKAYSCVQGYTKTSECSVWLTDLVYSYDFVYVVATNKDNDIKLSKSKEIYPFLKKLADKIKGETENNINNQQNNDITTNDDNKIEIKRALYYTLKNLYDKWLCGYCHDEFKLNPPDKDLEFRKQRFCQSITETNSKKINTSEYNNFVYVDQFFNDISSKYMMDVDTISKKLVEIYTGNKNIDIYSFMSFMAEKNKLMLIALPVYNNMYNAKSIASVFTPNTLYSVNNYDNSNGIGTTYVVMYASEVSHQSELYQGYEYCRDYPDLAGVATNQQPVDIKLFNVSGTNENSKLNYDVSAFAVSYSKQNQMYFKRVDVSMDNPKITDESTRNLLALSEGGSQGDINQPITVGQNIYSIYSNRSYTCTVEMMGCANIMPLMYFQLNNIPMFRGLYMIISVKHAIKAGDMTTVFTGVRVSRYSLPDLSRAILNSNIFGKLESSNAWKDGVAITCENDCLNLSRVVDFKKKITANQYMKDFVKQMLKLGWNKSVICGIGGACGCESNFKYWLVNEKEFYGNYSQSSANSTRQKPYVYGAGLIQWSLNRKKTLVENVTNENGEKLYHVHGSSSAEDYLISKVPELYDRRKNITNPNKLDGRSFYGWSGGIENFTMSEQAMCIDYELKHNCDKIGDTLKQITTDDYDAVDKATYTVYVKYVGGYQNTSGFSTKEDACRVSCKYSSQFGETTGIEKRIAYAEWMFENWNEISK